ncbi:nickel pincer cofactor biosynthesis protein LarB [Pontiella agarivorans]|uniref:Nickel pincer cofactor biosynthesis protein LarB n=1 Tax=Pontiella agarivorans TaxID=3038953 RepID=A0ABU5MTF0_9BACT|nr:nickel pincer cofactor biosynthesis protein LarB [Pontiella agarivorans]MDZ8117465.1 nickel pincer cofactor biosynthesis protein LarB [Pontiella agarivorans]
MEIDKLEALLSRFKNDDSDMEATLAALKDLPFEDMGFAKIDHHRALRTGYPEVVFCQGKTHEQVEQIFQALEKRNDHILLTRAEPELFQRLEKINSRLRYNELGRTIVLENTEKEKTGSVLIISAGTADIPVAEEAYETASISGARAERIYDAGVAGIHRLLAHNEKIQQARAIVCVAGMEGALPSVVGGLAPCPVIAVPTSVGYGSHLNGLAPLFTMLNSCAPNITVVNIDNGFGAGFNAALVNALK